MGKLAEFWASIHTFSDTCPATRTPGLECDSQKLAVKGSVVEIELWDPFIHAVVLSFILSFIHSPVPVGCYGIAFLGHSLAVPPEVEEGEKGED